MNPEDNKDGKSSVNTKEALSFMNLGFDDYLASRVLLMGGHLPQGAGLAATAVEKYLKAVARIGGSSLRGHLDVGFLRSIETGQPELLSDLSMDFLLYLARAYRLRYFDDIRPGFNIVISQYRTLAALDVTIPIIDSGFKIIKDGTLLDTPYRRAVQDKRPDLMRENAALIETKLGALPGKRNHVYEMRLTDDGVSIVAEYDVDGVRLDGGFRDRQACVIGSDPRSMQLSKG